MLADCSLHGTLFESELSSPIWQQSSIRCQEMSVNMTHHILHTTRTIVCPEMKMLIMQGFLQVGPTNIAIASAQQRPFAPIYSRGTIDPMNQFSLGLLCLL